MAVTPRMWRDLCAVLDRPELENDPRFTAPRERAKHDRELRDEITAWSMARDKFEAMRELAEGGVPASAVLDTRDLYENGHLIERGFIQQIEHPRHGRVRVLGWPARMSESSVPIQAAPLLGQHSTEVLAEDLALDGAELEALLRDGVIAGPTEQDS